MYKPLKKVNYFILFFMVVIFCATALFVVNLNFHSEENKVYAATYGNFVYENVSGGVKITGYNATGTVNIPEDINGKKVVEISQDAFQGNTGITVVNIPRYVVKVGSYTKVDTFVGCSSLQAINVDTENDYYKSDSGVFYSHENGVPITLNVYPANRSGTSYTVLSGTKYIGSGAFKNAKNLTRISLASTVYHIGNFAFEGCSNLDFFTIVSSVRIVGAFAFKDCTKLNTLTISSTDFTLGQYAFQNTRIYNDASDDYVYSRGNWVLGYKNTTYASDPNYPETWGLTGALTIPSGTVGIAGGAFDGSRISSVNFPSTLKYIGDNAFSFIRTFEPGSVNISIDIPASVEKIGAYAFYKSRISTVKLNGTSLTHIGARAFSDIQISSITIPSSVQEIGDEAFRDCTSLSTISFTANNIKRIGKDAFTNTAIFNASTGVRIINNWVVGNRNGATGSPSFSNVRGFADYALEGTSITGASLPSTVYYIGEGAFKDCSNLSSVSISGNVDYIPPYAFAGCTSLKSITINSGVKTIGEKAFNGSMDGSPTINIPDSVQTIEDYAFQDSNVGRLNFNSSSNLGHIGNYAFYGSALNTINIPASVEFIGRYAFRDTGIYNSASTNSFVYINNWAVDYKGDRSSLDSVSIDGSTKGFASLTFANMQALERVILPASVNYIGDHAFYMCYNLEKVMVLTSTVATAGKGIYNNVKNGDHEVVTYVMQNQVNNYKAAQNWENYDNYIDSIAVVNISKQTGGNIINGSSGYYFPDEGMALQVSYNQGYYFTGWWSGASVLNRSKAYTYTTQRGDQTILAKFNAIDVNNINETFDNAIVPASFNPISGYNSLITYSTGAVAPINAGSHTATIKVRCTALNNEVVGEKTIAINISKRTLYITPQANPITYGDDPPASYNMQTDNVAPNDSVTVNVTGSCDYQKYDDVGAYDIYVKAADQTFSHNNYTPQYQTGTLIVNKKKVTLSIAVVGDVYYGDNPPENFTFNYSGLVNGDQISDTAYTDYYYKGNAGSYNIYVTEKAHTNYYVDNIASAKGTFTVKKKPITVIIYDQYIDYGDSIPTFTYSQGDLVSGDSNLTHIVETDYVLGESDCGEYSITPVDGQNNFTNYDVTYVNGTLTVYQKTVELTINDENIEYGDAINDFSFSYDGVVFNQESLFDQEYQYVTTNYNQFDDIGTYPLYFDYGYENPPEYTNYFVNRRVGMLTVSPRKLKITPNDIEIEYGMPKPTEITFNFENVVNDDILTATGEILNCDDILPLAGIYDIVVTGFNETLYKNYTWNQSGIGKLIVNKRKVYFTVDDMTVKYGEELGEFVFNVTGVLSQDHIEYSLSASVDYQPFVTNAGTILDIIVINSYSGEYPNYEPVYQKGALTVIKADAVITAEEYQLAPYMGSKVYPVAYLNHDEASIIYNPDGAIIVAEYTFTLTAPATQNYNAPEPKTVLLKIEQRYLEIKVLDVSKVYGESDPVFGYTVSGLAEGDTLDIALRRQQAAVNHVGSYEITYSRLDVYNDNGDNVTAFYDYNYISAYLTIMPFELTITAQSSSKIYGESDPDFEYTVSHALKYSDRFTGRLSREAGEHVIVGVYQITMGTLAISDGNNGLNYDINFINDSAFLTINPRTIYVQGHNKSKVYGEDDPEFTYEISSGSLVNGDYIYGQLERETGQTVNEYHILQGNLAIEDGNQGENYIMRYNIGILTITQRDIEISAHNKSKTYGEQDPEFTFSITKGNLVYEDEFWGYLTRVTGENVGKYAISKGVLRIEDSEGFYREDNYSVTFINAELTITQREIEIIADNKTKIYGQNDPTFTFVLAAGSMGLAFSDYWSGTLSRDMGENVDSYVINRGSLGINGLYDNGNYIITFNSGILTITRKAIQVVADASQSKIYGFSDPILTFHVPDNGLEFGDELQGELTRRAGEDVGFYEIYQNNVDNNNNPNYDITFVSNLFEIIQRPITIQADPKGKVYGEDDPELTYSISAGSYGLAFDDELAGSLEREWGINVGYYDILQGSVTTSNNPNYQITFKFQGNDFEITQRPITLSADYINKVYGDGDPALTYSIVSGNLVYSDKVSITLIRDTGENVGSYEIDQEYLEIYSENDEIISFNYQITFIKGEFEITQRYLYIKGDDLSKSYGQDDPPVFTYQITQGELVWDDEIGGALTREPGNNAGTYKILIGSLTAGENYKIVYTHGEFEIIPLPIKIVADEQVKTYGDLDPEFTHTITAGEIMPGDDLEITLSRESGEDIGIYEITVGSVSNANYEISLESGHLTIIPREIKVSADRVEKVYGFEDPELTYIVEEGELAFDDTLTHRLERVLGEDVGVYAITLIEVEKDNYIIDFTGNDFIIHERPITIQADYKEKVYGEDDPELTYSFVAGSLGLAFEDELWGELIRDAGDFVDEYIIRQGSITDENNTNYLITFIEGVFSITRRDVTVTPDILTKYYGEDDPFFTYTVGENDLVYEDTLVGELTRVLGENVGFYRILNGGITNENNPNYNIILIPIDFEIERRHITVTPDILTKYYGEGDPFFTYTVGENDLVFDDTLVGELTRVLGENVGLYQILNGSLTNENNTNYDITLSEVYFEIERRPITLTADDMSKTYGDQDPPVYTYQLSENALVFNDVLQGRLTREAGDVVGHYTILQGGITNENNPNYDITYVEADFEIIRRPIELHANYHEKIYGYPDPVFSYQIIGETVPGDMLQGSLQRAPGNNVGRYTIYQGTIDNENNPNYDITFKGNILIINPRPLIILADMIEKIYGEEDPALTYTFLQGSLAYEDVLYGSLFRQVGEDVGRYTISVGDIAQHPGNRNYSITYQYNSFEIIPRPITIQADQKSKVYGEADPKLTYQIVEGSLVEGDSIRGSLVRIIGNDVGEYEILQGTVNNLENGNYDISYIGNTLEITPRPITITVDDGLEKYYGNQDPEFTYKVTEGNLAYYDTLKGEFIRDQGEQVGFYEIYQGTINEDENPNYQITFIGNCLEIRRRPIVVAPAYLKKIYGEEDPELTHEVIEGGLVFDDELVGAIYREPGEQAGEYEIYQGTLTTENNDNYLITYHHRPFIIERRPIVLTAERRSKVYGIADPTFAYEITEGNLVGSDVLVGQLNREQGEDVGEYRIIHGTLNLDNNPNYNIILTEVYFEITPKLIVVSANYRSKIYGNSDPTLTYEITYGDLIEGDELSGSLEREEGEAVGQYEITLGTLGNRNYDIIFESNTFAIHKRPLTLYALEQTHRHGEIIELEMAFGIEGNPLSQDIELINEAVKVVTPATSDSPVGTYPIEIVPLYDLENYSLTFIPSILTIIAGTFEVGEEIWFEDKRVIYDGTEHSILAGWNLEGVTVTYANNSGTEVGIYHATATFHKEHYLDVTLNARLIIMTKQITTTEPVPRGIVSAEGGFDPHVVPVIHQSTDENILTLANSILNVDLREEVKTILNIRLQADSEEIVPSSTVEIKLLIPSQIDNLESLRLVHITSTGINNVEYVIEGDYIVFYGYELGDYAFITAQEAPSYEKTAQIIFYTSTGAIGLIVFVIISTAFRKKKKRLKRGGRYL